MTCSVERCLTSRRTSICLGDLIIWYSAYTYFEARIGNTSKNPVFKYPIIFKLSTIVRYYSLVGAPKSRTHSTRPGTVLSPGPSRILSTTTSTSSILSLLLETSSSEQPKKSVFPPSFLLENNLHHAIFSILSILFIVCKFETGSSWCDIESTLFCEFLISGFWFLSSVLTESDGSGVYCSRPRSPQESRWQIHIICRWHSSIGTSGISLFTILCTGKIELCSSSSRSYLHSLWQSYLQESSTWSTAFLNFS